MMNILIGTQSVLDPILVEQLVQLPEASIYLSISQEDTIRIINEINPSILITDRAFTPASLLQQLTDCHKGLDIYIYDKKGTESGNYLLTRYKQANMNCTFWHSMRDFTDLVIETTATKSNKQANNNYPK